MEVKRFTPEDWKTDGPWRSVSWQMQVPADGMFVRARGSNTPDATPPADIPDEDPWQDLWFYANPVFVEVAR
jgi:hypothetical protein